MTPDPAAQAEAPDPAAPAASPGGPRRRGFLKALSLAIGAVLSAAMAVPVLRYVLFPARARTVDSGDEPIAVADEGAVRAGGPPVRAEIVAAAQRDGWAKGGPARLGACWLVRAPDGAIRAFPAACPHLGCAVEWDAGAGKFRCPCHASAFGVGGDREWGPAKRGLDPLDVRVEGGRILVRFRRFAADRARRAPI